MTIPGEGQVEVPPVVRRQAANLATDIDTIMGTQFPVIKDGKVVGYRGVSSMRQGCSFGSLKQLGLFIAARTWAKDFYQMTVHEQRQTLLQLSEGRSRN